MAPSWAPYTKAKPFLFPPLAPEKMVTPYHTVFASSQNRVKFNHSRLYFCLHAFLHYLGSLSKNSMNFRAQMKDMPSQLVHTYITFIFRNIVNNKFYK